MSDILGPSWNISQKGLEIITDNNEIKEKSKILENALNSDLKDISAGILNKKSNTLANVVLQVQKVRNISAPKANEDSQAAPRMLKLTFTDGESYLQAIEVDPIPQINRDRLAPGTKLLIKNAPLEGGYLLLNDKSFTILGGHVDHLYDKWEASKMVQLSQNRQQQSSADGGPPMWVNFGCKINRALDEIDFKSLDASGKNNKESSEFDQQRQEAIAEASSGAIKKVFGGGVKQAASGTFVAPPPPPSGKYNNPRNKRNPRGGKNLTTANNEVEDQERPQKPSEKVSLFAFLEDKLPAATETVPTPKPQQQYPNPPYRSKTGDVNAPHRPKTRDANPPYRPKTGEANPPYRPKTADTNPSYKPKTEDAYPPYRPKMENAYPPYRPKTEDAYPPYRSKTGDASDKLNNLVNKMDKVTLNNHNNNENSKFVSRSFRQHLNLPANQTAAQNNGPRPANQDDWRVGQECLAKYWEDGKHYNAFITAVTEKTNVVKFKGYGNIEEVLKVDCMPVLKKNQDSENTYGKTKYYSNKRF